jgi:hypothetical protein
MRTRLFIFYRLCLTLGPLRLRKPQRPFRANYFFASSDLKPLIIDFLPEAFDSSPPSSSCNIRFDQLGQRNDARRDFAGPNRVDQQACPVSPPAPSLWGRTGSADPACARSSFRSRNAIFPARRPARFVGNHDRLARGRVGFEPGEQPDRITRGRQRQFADHHDHIHIVQEVRVGNQHAARQIDYRVLERAAEFFLQLEECRSVGHESDC